MQFPYFASLHTGYLAVKKEERSKEPIITILRLDPQSNWRHSRNDGGSASSGTEEDAAFRLSL
ncbi:hypothetical protein [Coxiella burnetii]|uniref:hypothetical protein n=4 Tax=Coxiella burnetii TaxID=777 RepID=UPI0000ED032E|nr:hypothetical protein [Coxiella burnetii]ACJ20819.1 hypothetical protein CbuK_1678 [Coxiella burnetii CbuK_Q154]AIT63899.1 hypothetical protein CBNA_1679 [Coxiella burnetii str. Namibia]ATN86402.1 hypothetical protein AYO29_08190 [Coxiella burnetii str. Schperling]EAX32081.1 hypothetical protein A35_08530 [Coxiella burnetii 'MSU Goat Q177']PHH57231.1 hypothetical protein CRH12_06735 [Coxiella burnetii]